MNWICEGPIIKSLLDTDFYKFTMGQLVFRRYQDIKVVFGLINRSGAPLARFIREDDLRKELDYVRKLRFNNSELHYLRGTNEYGDRMFGEDFLQFLKNMELPPYDLRRVGEDYWLEFSGAWPKVMYWEITALSIISELYYRAQLEKMSRFGRDVVYADGTARLLEKIKALRQYPDITLSDFGTRRRFSGVWHNYLIGVLKEELPKQMRGTSNVLYAMNHGLLPMGTSAHELPMVVAAVAFAKADGSRPDLEILSDAQNQVLREWYELYGSGLSIALTDTFGSDFFFRTAPADVARGWKGTRQDSGDPFDYGEKAIGWYERRGIDPKDKLIVFSDQLNVELMIELHRRFRGRIGHTFGIGTNLTNDLGLKPISIVVKASKANGHSTVKLSDNPAKAMGESEEVRRYKQAADYINTKAVECVS
ncbi:MAG: nicotinate phosphoribosyltransferase [Patescibacteria group bacterium]